MSSVLPERLTLLALGIRGDQPQDPQQPPLADGVHLRWAPAQELGFPWHGFYLFRRETRPSRRCLAAEFPEKQPGKISRWKTPIGTLASQTLLHFGDDFPDAGVLEADLAQALTFDLPTGVETDRVDFRIGFRAEGPKFVRKCVDFRKFPLGSGPNPRTVDGAIFTVHPARITVPAPDASVELFVDGPAGLEFTSPVDVTYRLEITLPCPAREVRLLMTNRELVRVEGFEPSGTSTGVQEFARLALHESAATVRGEALRTIFIEASTVDAVLLHEVCWECPAAGATDGGGVRNVLVDFTKERPGEHMNPLLREDVRFEVEDENHDGIGPILQFSNRDVTGLLVFPRATITLPCTPARAELNFTGVPTDAFLRIEVFNADGTQGRVASFQLSAPLENATVIVEGTAIQRIVITAPNDFPPNNPLLHKLRFDCGGAAESEITVTGSSPAAEVTRTTVRGAPGAIVSGTLTGEQLTSIAFTSGKAVLLDLCYTPTRWSQSFGWRPIEGFQYPLCLPVAVDDYPCVSKPANADAARTLALSRVTYDAPAEREQGFWDLHAELVRLVRNGPAGGAMADRTRAPSEGASLSAATQESPALTAIRPLDLVYLASLHPAYAQMLGMYFVDRNVAPGQAFDYLLLADATGVLGGTAQSALDWLGSSPNATDVDVQLILDRRAESRPPIAPPQGVRAYALPGGGVRELDGSVHDVAGNVGLWWPLPGEATAEEPDRIIFYFARRADLGVTRPPNAPAAAQYKPVLGPLLISEPDPPPPPNPDARSSDWPPSSLPMHAVDSNLPEGWYSYRFSGQDLFGRRSALGPPAEWYEWDPLASVDSFAVALLDKTPPPSPLGVEAWALDPLDRWIFADAEYDQWRSKVAADLVGLRVRWRWTLLQQLQAPDTHTFRLYYQPGRWNALLAKTTLTTISGTESFVELDLAYSGDADDFAGARLRVGNDDFAILGSDPGANLRLRVKNIGAQDEIAPAQGKGCTIAIPEGHALWVDTGTPQPWAKRLAIVDYEPPTRTGLDPVHDANGKRLSHTIFNAAPLVIHGSTARLPIGVNLSGIQPWVDHLHLVDANGAIETLRIVQFDVALRTVTVDIAPSLTPVEWTIGRPAREYEVFLPMPDTGAGHPFEPALTEPVVYAQIAVSAADARVHVADTFPGGTEVGNESRLSPSATVYRVLQKPPDAPELPPLPSRLFATPADWRDRSYSTFRFTHADHLRVHLLRALDDTLFQRDWLIRETRRALDPIAHAEFFPDDATINRAAAAATLNAIKSASAYGGLSAAVLKVLAMLPGNEGVPAKELAAHDWLIRQTRTALSSADGKLFPTDWSAVQCDAAADALNAIASFDDYETLEGQYDAFRVLASLPGNEAAFTQVTNEPLEMSSPALTDTRRADDPAGYLPQLQSTTHAYTDVLPGRATNRYFYRAAFVDGAQNQSALSLAGPPVYLQNVEPPRTPVITGVVSGERVITVMWAVNRDRDLARYRLYRTDDKARAEDLRWMNVVAELEPADVDPLKPGPEVTDRFGLIGGQTVFYRVTAIDTAGNESLPSRVAMAMVVDSTPPPAPNITNHEWMLLRERDRVWIPWPQTGIVPDGHRIALRVTWQSNTPAPRFAVARRRRGERMWSDVTGAVETSGTQSYSIVDRNPDPTTDTAYRIRVRALTGVWSDEETIASIGAPVPPAVVATEDVQ